MEAYERHIQIGLIVQGLQIYLSVCFSALVWKSFGCWFRTMKKEKSPSELVVAYALRNTFADFLLGLSIGKNFKKFLFENMDAELCPNIFLNEVGVAA